MSSCIGLFYALRLAKHVRCTFIFTFVLLRGLCFVSLLLICVVFSHVLVKFEWFLNMSIRALDGTPIDLFDPDETPTDLFDPDETPTDLFYSDETPTDLFDTDRTPTDLFDPDGTPTSTTTQSTPRNNGKEGVLSTSPELVGWLIYFIVYQPFFGSFNVDISHFHKFQNIQFSIRIFFFCLNTAKCHNSSISNSSV